MYWSTVVKSKFGLFAFLSVLGLSILDEKLWAVELSSTLSNSVVFCMPLDEGEGNAVADTTKVATGTLVNFGAHPSSSWVDGIQGDALRFDGVNDYVELVGNNLSLPANFTVSVWVNPKNASGTGAILSVRSIYQASGFRFFIAGNSLVLQGQTTSGWKFVTLGNNIFSNNSWYHLVITYNGGTMQAYVNGVSVGSANWGSNLVMNPSTPSRIGSEVENYFNGIVDELMFFSVALREVDVQSLFKVTRPNGPYNLTAAAVSPSQINLNWTHDGTGMTGFLVKRGTTPTGPWTNVANLPASARSFSDTGLTSAATYTYKIRAYWEGSPPIMSKASNKVTATTQGQEPPPPTAPANLLATPISPSQIRLTWQDNSNNELGFILERSLAVSGPWTRLVTLGANATSYTDGSLTPSTTYYYRMSAYN